MCEEDSSKVFNFQSKGPQLCSEPSQWLPECRALVSTNLFSLQPFNLDNWYLNFSLLFNSFNFFFSIMLSICFVLIFWIGFCGDCDCSEERFLWGFCQFFTPFYQALIFFFLIFNLCVHGFSGKLLIKVCSGMKKFWKFSSVLRFYDFFKRGTCVDGLIIGPRKIKWFI